MFEYRFDYRTPKLSSTSKMELGDDAILAWLSWMAFTFENLDVYKRAVQFAVSVDTLLAQNSASLNRSMADQLSRASLSISLNIAEGNGRWHQADKRQFFWIARGSVFECAPLIEILRIKELLSDLQYQGLRRDLEALGKMLTKLVQAHTPGFSS